MVVYLALLVALGVHAIDAATGSPAGLVNNARPRSDTTGGIVNAHQGSITWFDHLGKYLWVGSAFVPDATPEDPLNGCANMSYGAPGFNNNPISMYASATLGNEGWELVSGDLLGRGRELGEYWEPNLVWNPGHGAQVRRVGSCFNTTLSL
jgi:hypothetical protein